MRSAISRPPAIMAEYPLQGPVALHRGGDPRDMLLAVLGPPFDCLGIARIELYIASDSRQLHSPGGEVGMYTQVTLCWAEPPILATIALQ